MPSHSRVDRLVWVFVADRHDFSEENAVALYSCSKEMVLLECWGSHADAFVQLDPACLFELAEKVPRGMKGR